MSSSLSKAKNGSGCCATVLTTMRLQTATLLTALISTATCQSLHPNDATNPIIPGWNPDPAPLRVGDDYYVATSTFEYFPGVPIYHSTDLVNWELFTHVLVRPEQLRLYGTPTNGGEYPDRRHHVRMPY